MTNCVRPRARTKTCTMSAQQASSATACQIGGPSTLCHSDVFTIVTTANRTLAQLTSNLWSLHPIRPISRFHSLLLISTFVLLDSCYSHFHSHRWPLQSSSAFQYVWRFVIYTTLYQLLGVPSIFQNDYQCRSKLSPRAKRNELFK